VEELRKGLGNSLAIKAIFAFPRGSDGKKRYPIFDLEIKAEKLEQSGD